MHRRTGLFFFVLLFSTLLFAQAGDPIIVRLRSGAQFRGEIVERTNEGIIVRDLRGTKYSFPWSDIVFIAAMSSYDSLRATNGLPEIILQKKSELIPLNLQADFGFDASTNRGLGMAGSVGFGLGGDRFLNGIFSMHLGTTSDLSQPGSEGIHFWGITFAQKLNVASLIVCPSVGISQTTIRTSPQFSSGVFRGSEERACGVLSSTIFVDAGQFLIGGTSRYLLMGNSSLVVIYLSVGSK